MQLTPKKLKVSANINMAYVINYLSLNCGYTNADAFYMFTKTHTYRELMDLRSTLCTALAPELLFMLEEETGINIPDDDDKLNDAFNIPEKLRYIVNITEALREALRLSPSSYAKYLKKHKIWEFTDDNYEQLSPLKREAAVSRLKTLS